ncbi:MAG TPA: type II 3-dehydroquinate dehydratase [Candidatus Omnitrophota bacterium]|nr:type II 3-dehydroquinate dehydratase [Candidatus Omnitrophota bacterium]HPN66583.1 type II 3-dehydroquinate dehydratase [Candidatus Omnitrophota bacterium]
MKKILVIHGPNLNLLGSREVGIYGKVTLKQIDSELSKIARAQKVSLETFQSSHEGEIVEKIGGAKGKFDCILINPAAYTHTSVAIRDAIAAVSIPAVEVHLSNIHAREEFRRTSLISPVAAGQVSGFGLDSYRLGLMAAIGIAKKTK